MANSRFGSAGKSLQSTQPTNTPSAPSFGSGNFLTQGFGSYTAQQYHDANNGALTGAAIRPFFVFQEMEGPVAARFQSSNVHFSSWGPQYSYEELRLRYRELYPPAPSSVTTKPFGRAVVANAAHPGPSTAVKMPQEAHTSSPTVVKAQQEVQSGVLTATKPHKGVQSGLPAAAKAPQEAQTSLQTAATSPQGPQPSHSAAGRASRSPQTNSAADNSAPRESLSSTPAGVVSDLANSIPLYILVFRDRDAGTRQTLIYQRVSDANAAAFLLVANHYSDVTLAHGMKAMLREEQLLQSDRPDGAYYHVYDDGTVSVLVFSDGWKACVKVKKMMFD